MPDLAAVRLTNKDLSRGSLNVDSYARPLKLFTAHGDLIVKRIAVLKKASFRSSLEATIEALQQNIPVRAAFSPYPRNPHNFGAYRILV